MLNPIRLFVAIGILQSISLTAAPPQLPEANEYHGLVAPGGKATTRSAPTDELKVSAYRHWQVPSSGTAKDEYKLEVIKPFATPSALVPGLDDLKKKFKGKSASFGVIRITKDGFSVLIPLDELRTPRTEERDGKTVYPSWSLSPDSIVAPIEFARDGKDTKGHVGPHGAISNVIKLKLEIDKVPETVTLFFSEKTKMWHGHGDKLF